MQLTPAAGAQTSKRPAARAAFSRRLDHPAAASVIAFAAWLGFALARWQVWARGQLGLFVMAGARYSAAAHLPHVPSKGYDGQFYYRFALNPFNWHPTAYGITIDHNYRYTRMGYPLLVWILSGGQHAAVPEVMVAVNLLCVAGIAGLGAVIARQAGRHALWGLLFAGYFGLVISVGRDTAEPLADLCLLGSLLLYRRSRYVAAAVVLAYGVITNEPLLAMAVAIALTRLHGMYRRRRLRPGLEDLIWILPALAYLVLQGAEKLLVTGKAGAGADITANFTLPFKAMVPAIVRDFRLMSWTHLGLYDINLIELITLLVVVGWGLLVLRSTLAPARERVAFAVFVVIEMVIASGQFWDSVFGDGRTYIDAFLMALVLLVSTPASAGTGTGVGASADTGTGAGASRARRVITSRHLAVIAAFTIAALIVVARRRILFQ